MTTHDSTTVDPTHTGREPNENESEDATRCLSAAAHLDADFAELAIERYLSEPRRGLPPSPGVDSVAVLEEALAARGRRLRRDLAVSAFLVVIAILDLLLLLVWAGLIGAGYLARAVVRAAERNSRPVAVVMRGRGTVLTVLITAVLVPTAVVLLSTVLGSVSESETALRFASGLRTGIALLLVVAVSGVLLADELVVDRVLKHRFSRNGFVPGGPPSPGAAPSPGTPTTAATPSASGRGLSAQAIARHRARLETIRQNQRVSDAGDGMTHNNITVYAGERAFVGSGDLDQTWSMALQLLPADPDAGQPREPLRPRDLYRAVDEEMRSLRESDALAPDLRLRSIAGEPQAIVSAAALLRRRRDRIATAILPSPEHMPASSMPEEELNTLADSSREWIRHYQCFRVESWDRHLVISVFLHIGCDDKTLYIEWNSFRLTPIDARFVSDDWAERTTPRALGRAVRDTFLLPASMTRRVSRIVRYAREQTRRRRGVDEHTFGATVSLRELATAGHAQTYFQESDSFRYRKILERRALAAISTHLQGKGFSTTELHGRVNTVINNTVVNGGVFSGVTVVGQENKTTVVPAEPVAPPDREARG
ncbi:hypothetical protein FHR81_002932 [Actinoalloteichus hoggarensis]|uniref:Uncharacterized protein n=1 Tax=Actinoalloteichus hoggarensis TaxID=1470176 RepID=A0A221VYC2_9PSEU|nr:hypothetical protein [Actinoalloteichus hoggarensis]ASO18523.1 hypothetical protein AHOG_04335 [Actinoalloteichus hoggarensis]MBB5921892.1 hypothetical protein [Actinoalloteichus hoggarensis]